MELWPVEGVVTCAVSDEYLGNSTTLEALGGSGGGGGKDVSRLLTDVFLRSGGLERRRTSHLHGQRQKWPPLLGPPRETSLR